jgi:hypothetical protein
VGGGGGTATSVVINEVDSNPVDFIELHNLSATAVDIGGWSLTDNDPTAAMHRFTFPSGTMIAAGGYLAVNGVNGGDGGAADFPFGLGSADSAILYGPAPALDVVDMFSWTVNASDAVTPSGYSRCPDGTGAFVARPLTEGLANNCPPERVFE